MPKIVLLSVRERMDSSSSEPHKPARSGPLISEQWDGVLFLNYLRECFRWGGFPGFKEIPDPPIDEIEFLTKDLLPL